MDDSRPSTTYASDAYASDAHFTHETPRFVVAARAEMTPRSVVTARSEMTPEAHQRTANEIETGRHPTVTMGVPNEGPVR